MENLVFPTIDPELALAVSLQKSQGLMHLLAVAYTAKDDRNAPPTQDEADGICSLVSQVREDLEELIRRVDGMIAQSKRTGQKGADS